MDDQDTPCVGICTIGDDGRCIGCGRTEEDIYGTPTPPAATASPPAEA